MSLIFSLLLAGWLVIGHIVLMVTLANRLLFRMADHPLKPLVYLLHAILWPALAAILVAVIGLPDLADAFLGRLDGFAGRIWPWLWFTGLAPVYGLAVIAVTEARRRPPEELVRKHGTILPADTSRLVTPQAKAAARWELRRIEVAELTLALRDLPAALDGLRIAHLTDLHYDGEPSDALLSVAIREVRAADPDLIVLTGDFVVEADDTPGCVAAIAPLIDDTPAYGVLGNHDVWADRDGVDRALTQAGVRMLHNENVRIERGGHAVRLAGVDDYWDERTDLQSALEGACAEEPAILLSHNPDQIIAASRAGVLLQLSGHTHGGHIALPVLGPFVVPSRYGRRFARGLHKVGDTVLYVNVGLSPKPRIRIGSTPQVALLTLTCGPDIAHTVSTG